MAEKKLIIFGTGEIGMLARFYFERDSNFKVIAFSADDEFISSNNIDNIPLIPFSQLQNRISPDKSISAHVALSYNKLNQIRADKYKQVKNLGYNIASYVCSKSVYWDDLSIGDNCFILENQTIQPDVKIGSNVMIWSGNHIGHGSVIKDHTYISSHVCLSGHTEIGSHCFLGVNSMTKDFVKIGNNVFVTMGAMISKNVENDSVVLGNPGKIYSPESEIAIKLKKKYFNL